MGCLKGKNKTDKTKAKYSCKKCDALTTKKKDLCKPVPYKSKKKSDQKVTKKNDEKYFIGVDIGGTKIAVYIFDKNLKKQAKKKRKTKSLEGEPEGIDRVIETIDSLLKKSNLTKSNIASIGIAVPGILNSAKGIVIEAPNLGWKNLKIKKIISDFFNCPVLIANDVDAGVFGEFSMGAGKNHHSVLGIFPGTGVGGGFIKNGELFTSPAGSCLEVGHIQLQPGGPKCGCGKRGCLETLAGRLAISAEVAKAAYRGEAPYILSQAGTDISLIKSGLLKEAVDNGDKAVKSIIKNSAEWLGVGIAALVNIVAPEIVIIGGGLSESMPDLIVRTADEKSREKVLPSLKNSYKVQAASLGDDAVPLGAAALAIKQFSKEK